MSTGLLLLMVKLMNSLTSSFSVTNRAHTLAERLRDEGRGRAPAGRVAEGRFGAEVERMLVAMRLRETAGERILASQR